MLLHSPGCALLPPAPTHAVNRIYQDWKITNMVFNAKFGLFSLIDFGLCQSLDPATFSHGFTAGGCRARAS